jgi:rubrerythrin
MPVRVYAIGWGGMNWTLFTSTFVMIFLAELGDKTQLAVMSQSGANASFKLTVFAAGALALTASTAIGVLAGGLLQKLVPDERYIKLAGGALFLVFGALMLREGFAPRVARAAPRPEPVAVPSVLGRLVLRQAAAFERAALDDYRALAARASTGRVRELFERIAAEEAAHGALMEHMGATISGVELQAALPAAETLIHDVAAAAATESLGSDHELLTHAIEHERATAAFYRALEQGCAIPSLRSAFARSAADEERHAAWMEALLEA